VLNQHPFFSRHSHVSEQEQQKKHFCSNQEALISEQPHLPGKPVITTHIAQVLRQAEGALLPEGGWVGGDAWLGSIMSAVELKSRST